MYFPFLTELMLGGLLLRGSILCIIGKGKVKVLRFYLFFQIDKVLKRESSKICEGVNFFLLFLNNKIMAKVLSANHKITTHHPVSGRRP